MDIDLSNVVAVLIVLAPLTLLIVGLFALNFGENLDEFIPPLQEWEWPQGVQEEEPVGWRIERLGTSERQIRTDPVGTTEGLRRAPGDLRSTPVA